MRPSQFLATVLLCASLSSATLSPPSQEDLGRRAEAGAVLDKRQNRGHRHGPDDNDNSNNNNNQDTRTDTTSVSRGKSTSSSTSREVKTTAKGSQSSDSPTRTTSKTTSTTGKSNKKSSSTSIPFSAYPGGVNWLTPAPTSAASLYYGVGTVATWVWNYTSLLVTPTAIDILATVIPTAGGLMPSPFTIAANQSWEKTQTFKWDTGKYYTHTSALPVGSYTLMVYNADEPQGYSALAKPGQLAVFEQFYFGVYTPQPFKEMENPFVCATCNAAGGQMEKLTLRMLGGVVGITMATFLWFAGVNGVIF